MAEDINERLEETKKFIKRYVDLYSTVRTEQRTDLTYIEDTFETDVKDPHREFHSGIGRRMVDAPAEHIVTSNPQFFCEPIKGTKGAKESASRISKVVNEQWIPTLRLQDPNPFKQSVKNKLGRGESGIKLAHNDTWIGDKENRTDLPVHFLILDPMVVYNSPEKSGSGVPERNIIKYERQPWELIVAYPALKDILQKKVDEGKMAEWVEVWDNTFKYCEVDNIPVPNPAISPHFYGVTPFVRKYSGFGTRSPDGELASLIVSDIRFSRSLIKEECSLRSDIASKIHLSGHKPVTLELPPGISPENTKKLKDELQLGAYGLNLLPAGTKFIEDKFFTVAAEELLRLREVKEELAQRCPFLLAGFPYGAASGRERDVTFTAAMRRYDTVIENTENEWATAIGMALKIIDNVPGMNLPDGLQRGDLKHKFTYRIKLKASDPIEDDRLVTQGDRLWMQGQGSISLKTNHMKYQGMTEDEHEDEVAEMMADRLMLFNPDVASVYGAVFGEEAGLEQMLEGLRQQNALQQQRVAPTTQQRIQGEAQTRQGVEAGIEPNRGGRVPPERYTRGP
jgi:hypothetical protein